MALYYDLPVYRDTYQLILKIFECTKDFSKEYKYTLGQDMKKNATRKGSIFFYLDYFVSAYEFIAIQLELHFFD